MLVDAVAGPLALFALALPYVFGYTQPPNSNFWPVAAAWCCALVLLAALAGRTWWARRQPPGARPVPLRVFLAAQLAAGLLLAACLSAGIGLWQYFVGDPGLYPWVQPSTPGVAMGNLRQRNQQASLLGLGLWSLLWILAQVQARLAAGPAAAPTPLQQALLGGGRAWPSWLAGVLMAWGIALLAVAGAATASRTGAAQWLLVVGLLVLWRASTGRVALALAVAGLVVYAVAAWLLPSLLLEWTGFASDGLYSRLSNDGQGCGGRRVLWTNVLYLIGQRPWLGWGWGELDYAHYITLFPGERFCVLLDNAHNLPLHLAVELGLPVALLVCATFVAWVARARPWREADPVRQLAWGVLAIVGVHSLLEFPLWYGPFQVSCLLALALLWRGRLPRWSRRPAVRAGLATALALAVALGAGIAYEYYRVSQLYKPVMFRAAAYRDNTLTKVGNSWFFADQVDFALLSTTTLTRENAAQVHALATELLHFSPEPRVVEPLIESAALLGYDDEASFHLKRYRIAYPGEYARWRQAASGAR